MMRDCIAIIATVCFALLLFHAPVQSKIITIEADGTGDFTNLTDALTAVRSARDTIFVGPGVYPGLTWVGKTVTILSTDGPDATILDGEGIDRVLIFYMPAAEKGKKQQIVDVLVRGFTIANGYRDNNGGAVRVSEGSHVTMENCIFRDNVCTYHGGAIFMRNDGSSLTLTDCEFIDNHGTWSGGVTNIEDTHLEIDRCTFIGNTADFHAACLYSWTATMHVSNSVFMSNSSLDVSGGIYYCDNAGGIVQNNTFHGNSSPGETAATILVQESPSVVVTRNIIAGEVSGHGLEASDCTFSHTCNLFWDNEMNDIEGMDPDPTEIFEDPLFCDPELGNLSIAYESPAAPENNDCGFLIGALEPDCHIYGQSTRLAMSPATPEKLTLHQNSPNPFNPSTRIAYYLPGAAHVTIDVYDVRGRLVSRLVDDFESRGDHVVDWNGCNSFGRSVESGLYFCRLKVGSEILTRKMLLLR